MEPTELLGSGRFNILFSSVAPEPRLGSDFWAKSWARLAQFFQKARVEKMAKNEPTWENTYSDKHIGNFFL